MISVHRRGDGPALFRDAEAPAPRSGGGLIWIVLAILLAMLLAIPAFA